MNKLLHAWGLRLIFLLFLVFDTGYSFLQHCQMDMDGDMAKIILPSPSSSYYQVLHDPFGFKVLFENKKYYFSYFQKFQVVSYLRVILKSNRD